MTIPERMVHVDEARERFGDLPDRMAFWLTRTDPLADAVIEQTRGWSRVRLLRTVAAALRGGPGAIDEAPDAVKALVDQVATIPTWLQRDRADRGGGFFLSTHVLGGIVLGARSLIAGYAAPAGNKPLVLSGRLQRGVNRRLAETSRFVHDVSCPGGLEPGADGVIAAVTVRLIHAQVRHMIRERADWNPEWGEPINQHDMMATILLFSLVWLEGIETLGVIPTERESEDVIHLWRYVGYLMGVEPELLPATRAEAERYASFIELTQAPPDDDARGLTRAFLDAGPSRDESSARLDLRNALIRALLGDELADDLAIPDSAWTNAVPLVGRLVRPLNALRQLPGGRRAATDIGLRYWRWILENNPSGIVDLTMPDELFGATEDVA